MTRRKTFFSKYFDLENVMLDIRNLTMQDAYAWKCEITIVNDIKTVLVGDVLLVFAVEHYILLIGPYTTIISVIGQVRVLSKERMFFKAKNEEALTLYIHIIL